MAALRRYKGQTFFETDYQARLRLKNERETAAAIRRYAAARRRIEADKRRKETDNRRKEADLARSVREAERARRELASQQKEAAKMQELERVQYKVKVYKNRIDCLLSIHKECGDIWDWETIKLSPPPTQPQRLNTYQKDAQTKLNEFKPSLCDKLFRRVDSKRNSLQQALERAKEIDEIEYQIEIQTYTEDYQDWTATIDIAEKISTGSSEAYLEAIKHIDPFEDICDLGSSFEFKVPDKSTIEVRIQVNSENVIPSKIKSLLKNGQLSEKKMPKQQFYEIYQDYVCGCVLRTARELFALLPIELVIVTAVGKFLNTQTGNSEEKIVVSVAIPKSTLETLKFSCLDPSDSMSNFVHRMKFKKTQGFSSVEAIKLSDLN